MEAGAVELDWMLDRAAGASAARLGEEVAVALSLGARIKAIVEAPTLPWPRLEQSPGYWRS